MILRYSWRTEALYGIAYTKWHTTNCPSYWRRNHEVQIANWVTTNKITTIWRSITWVDVLLLEGGSGYEKRYDVLCRNSHNIMGPGQNYKRYDLFRRKSQERARHGKNEDRTTLRRRSMIDGVQRRTSQFEGDTVKTNDYYDVETMYEDNERRKDSTHEYWRQHH